MSIVSYEDEIRGNPLRGKDIGKIKNIVDGSIKPAYYYCAYGMFNDAFESLMNAERRIGIFEEDVHDMSYIDRKELSLLKWRIKWTRHQIHKYYQNKREAAA